MKNKWVLLIETTDRQGLIFEITKILANNNLNIEKNNEFVDVPNNRFFMRSLINGELNEEKIKLQLQKILPNAIITLKKQAKKDIVILATKEPHALGDMLIKHQFGNLNANIKAVISNHEILKDLVKKFDIEFFYVNDKSRQEHEKEVSKIIDKFSPQYVVLAKYMLILSDDFVQKYPNKIINIHHSFLPAFIGASPYKQAFLRGVKIIGATSHFVTKDLDDGAIIFQDVVSVDHTFSPTDMALKGKDVETSVLANALKLVFDDRVFVYNNKTVIL